MEQHHFNHAVMILNSEHITRGVMNILKASILALTSPFTPSKSSDGWLAGCKDRPLGNLNWFWTQFFSLVSEGQFDVSNRSQKGPAAFLPHDGPVTSAPPPNPGYTVSMVTSEFFDPGDLEKTSSRSAALPQFGLPE
ncbi:Dual 3',5'-cyclic-AMP and -GMP phosphodiesterase 11A [Chionoecetes opilio]|uniref:Dual 3',5'-cyclic-AMP and -GMP phosphodiesterase 11A n=1 Tax=Chionoecetes opilio TaxID=41210 RepID=A0A8J4Y678_CHIOP|nr:Dual 3',5'-cyclic-AMP and -GMP phosphodiesterase 11A [Chionoecetes opilio]